MQTEIWVSYNYGGSTLVFSKTIDLPFTPFFGMGIVINEEKGYTIKLENKSYCNTIIDWNTLRQQFEVRIRNIWYRTVQDSVIDKVLDMFSDWERHDQTDITALKELMVKDNVEIYHQ